MSDQFGMDIIVSLEAENNQLREQIKVLDKALEIRDKALEIRDRSTMNYGSEDLIYLAKKQIEEEVLDNE